MSVFVFVVLLLLYDVAVTVGVCVVDICDRNSVVGAVDYDVTVCVVGVLRAIAVAAALLLYEYCCC